MNPSSTSDPWIGRLIGERQRYRLERVIGKGGMGDVYLAVDTLLGGQQVALKLLKDTLIGVGELRKRFEREVALCAALKSDHIVQVSDYGVTAESHPFYVMEYLRGQTLGQLLRKLSREGKRLSVERSVGLIRQVCDGLQLAHKGVTLWRDGATVSEHIQVVHRDLKPDNIFLVPTALGELVKILDFGIAKIRDEASEQTNLTSTFMGTFRYAAPEQLQVDLNLDGRADIYSLGIILYEMLSGSDPFSFGVKASRTSGILWGLAHASKQPQLLRTQPGCEQLPAQLEAVVMRCLQKLPDDRFQSVEELSLALQSCISSRMSGVPEREIDATLSQEIPPTPTLPRSLTPSEQSHLDPTIDQVPSYPQQSHLDPVVNQVLSPSRREDYDEARNQEVKTTPAPTHPHTQILLALGAGISVSLAVIGGIYVYIRSQSSTEVDSPQQFSPSPSTLPQTTKPQPSCDDPNSIFCPK